MKIRLAVGTSVAVVVLGLWNAAASAQPASGGAPVVVGRQFQLHSERIGEERSFLVHRPAHYDLSNARYPVLILLDGEEHFQHVSATVDFLADAGEIPAMLVIGVRNTDRYRDMDTTAPGSAKFLEFITDELIPAIDRDYRTHPYRVLVGHSGAGLFTLYSLINAPEAFRGYVSIAPAFGDHRELPQSIASYLEAHEGPQLNAEVFVAADDSLGMGLSGAYELSSYLQDRASRVEDVRFTFRHYPDESHSAVPLRSVHDALLRIFAGWQIEDPFALYELGGLEAIERHFAALSARLGFAVAVPEQALLGPFYQLEGSKRFTEAEQVIEQVIESFPESATALYYAGRLYMQMGNNALAVDTLKESLLLSPNFTASRSLLEYMKVDAAELVPQVSVADADLAKYVGGYGTSAVVFEIERRGDELVGKTFEREYELEAVSGSTFQSSAGTVSFRTDDRGRVTGLVIEDGGAALDKLR